MSHVTRTPLSRSEGQRSRSPGHFTHCHVGVSGSCSSGRGNMLAMGNRAMLPPAWRREALLHPWGRRGAGAYHGGRQPTACYESDE